MAAKFRVVRIGDESDRGPADECGVVLQGDDGESNTAVTTWCLQSHEHSKACAQALLDAQVISRCSKADPHAHDESCRPLTPRESITAELAARAVKRAAKPTVQVASMPTKDVQRVVDGKLSTVKVPDHELA